MIEIERFDPFNNRLCRNVRNALSESFKKVLEQNKMQPARRVSGFFLNDPLPACVTAYIDQRLAAYEQVLADVRKHQLDDPLGIAVAIWDRRLFFETHEYLEQRWMTAQGDEKKLLQAIIRAAGAYVHLEQGNLIGAQRIAAKAVAVLEVHQDRLTPYADPQLLLAKLRSLDPMPPTLAGTAGPGNQLIHMEQFTQTQIDALSKRVAPDRFSTGQSNRELHIKDISPHRGKLPAGIIWPVTTEEVSSILAYTYAEGIPVTPWGAGTSTEGNPLPMHGGLVMDMTRMDRIITIRPQDLQADVQPGVFRKTLNAHTGRSGLFFPPDPGADATIGGMIANNASGVQTIKYGATRDYVMRLVVVLPDGRVIHTGGKAHKSSSGYDLTRLFVGSEGTLGVVTEATLKLAGIPIAHLAATVTFETLEEASQTVAVLMGSGLAPAALELLTPELIALMNREKNLGIAEKPSLFCEFHGVSDAALNETAALAEELCRDGGALDFKTGVKERKRKELWRARHEAWETIHRAFPGRETLIVDAAVPISSYPQMVIFSQQQLDEKKAVGFVFGHAGDGNLHVVMVGDPADDGEWASLEEINDNIVHRAVEVGGTCTGEHGIGIGKRKFMQLEHGEGYGLMKQIKVLMDPKGLMNPGKMFL